jgi:hypothetical protein
MNPLRFLLRTFGIECGDEDSPSRNPLITGRKNRLSEHRAEQAYKVPAMCSIVGRRSAGVHSFCPSDPTFEAMERVIDWNRLGPSGEGWASGLEPLSPPQTLFWSRQNDQWEGEHLFCLIGDWETQALHPYKSYQTPYELTHWNHWRLAMDLMVSGRSMRSFQALQQAVTILS